MSGYPLICPEIEGGKKKRKRDRMKGMDVEKETEERRRQGLHDCRTNS